MVGEKKKYGREAAEKGRGHNQTREWKKGAGRERETLAQGEGKEGRLSHQRYQGETTAR